ncbi:TIGR04255 family protein [Paraburkholderia aromaticivorans]|uniref:TIGR04255 family protein n=1 Tax=Paraburkholderia aromaticivorans TaxID=2026199 RepID=A0A248VF47_9BURK|nr:TIGR04255 family protein [Paraburkholderia aromaticivorans]ASV97588.1 hypothetical protein CJU94_05065 [Paraburkholderia aromaticivorans]
MTDRSGILPHSPLLYALASVRFAPLPLLPSKIPEIHEQLRDATPLLQNVQQQTQLVMTHGATPIAESSTQAWLIMASDRSFGVQLGTEQVLFFARRYSRFAAFGEFITRCLGLLFEHMKFLDVTGTGVRYVDHIKPRQGETLADYVAEDFLTPPVPTFDPIGGVSQYIYGAGESQLRVRSVFSAEALSIPVDLIGLIATIQGPENPLILTKLQRDEMLLDMDSVLNFSQPRRQDLKEIEKTLDNLHKNANAFFRHDAVCTDFAFEVWRGEK